MVVHPLTYLAQAGLTNPAAVQAARNAAALQGIAKLRAAGFTDDEWRAMSPDAIIAYGAGGATPMRLAGGTELLGPAVTMAGINANYKLGRAGLGMSLLERQDANRRYLSELAQNPFNTVQYLENMAQTGQRLPMMERTVQPLKPIILGPGADPMEAQIRRYLGDDPDAFAAGGRKTIGPGAYVETDGDIAFTAGEEGAETVEIRPKKGNKRTTTPARRRGIISAVRQQQARPRPVRSIPNQVGGGVAPVDIRADAPLRIPTPALPQMLPSDEWGRQDLNGDGVINAADSGIAARRRAQMGALPPAAAGGWSGLASSLSKTGKVATTAAPKAPNAAAGMTLEQAKAFEAYDKARAQKAAAPAPVSAADPWAAFRGKTAAEIDEFNRAYNPQGPGLVSSSAAENARRAQAGTTQGLTNNTNRFDPNNATIIVTTGADGKPHYQVTTNQSPYQTGSMVYDARSGKTVMRPATQADLDAAQAFTLGRQFSGMSIGKNTEADSRGADNARYMLALNYQQGNTQTGHDPTFAQQAVQRATGRPYDVNAGKANPATLAADAQYNAGQRAGIVSGSASVPKGENVTPIGAGGSLSTASKLLANALRNLPAIPPEVIQALDAGQVPGISQIAPVWHLLLPSEKQAYAGLLSGTGQMATVQDIEELVERQRPA